MYRHSSTVCRSRRAIAALTITGAVMAGAAPAALAGADPLAPGGKVVIDLTNLPPGVSSAKFHSQRIGEDTYRYNICGRDNDEMDPTTGVGHTELCSGGNTAPGIAFKYQGDRAKTGDYEITWGPKGKLRGRVVGKSTILASVTKGRLSRSGFGAKIKNAALKLTPNGAETLNRAVKAKPGPFKAKKKIGTVRVETEPASVEVAEGTASFALDIGAATTLAQKGVGGADGVTATAPATESVPGVVSFPLVAGTRVPLTNRVRATATAQGVELLKKTSAVGGGCDAAHPVNTTFGFANPSVRFQDLLEFDTTASGVTTPGFDMASLSPSQITGNPDTLQVTVNASAVLTSGAASALNGVLGTAAEGCGASDFAGGDPFGALTVSATAR